MSNPGGPEAPSTLALELFQPSPDVLYSLDAIAHLAGVSRRSILRYCRAALVRPVFQPPYGVMAFTEEAIYTVRRVEGVRAAHGIGITWVKAMFDLLDEVNRLRAEVRFFETISEMSRATPKTRNLAERLIAYEMSETQPPETKAPAAFHVCERLRPHLSTLMGKGGFRALFSRALALASGDVLWLSALHVKADGSLTELADFPSQVDPKELTEGCVLLVAELLGLLVAFIGPNLTLQTVLTVWPGLPHDDLDFDKGDKHEKAK